MALRLSNRPSSPRTQLEQEKKIRREIANSNERRRMQSINAGFNSLRTMLPKHDGEKLSKAAILQHTAEYIYQLEQDKTKLLQEICQMKRAPQESDPGFDSVSPTKKIKVEKVKDDCHNSDSSADEGIQCFAAREVHCDSDSANEEIRSELIEVRKVLDRERRLRMQLEDQVRALEAQLYPERIKEIANQVQLQFQNRNTNDSESAHQVDETSAAVSSVVSDEIVAETIEIETHSCPESPQMQPTIVIQAPTSTSTSSTTFTIDSPQDLTAKSAKNSCKSSKSPQPAAIALPIDVPFIGSDSQNSEGQSTVTVQIIGLSTDAVAANSTSRQNLDTIVEAIRHLEGDHLFRDEDESSKMNKVNAVSEIEENSEEESTVKVTVSSEQLGAAIRQQVIQSLPIQSRPGVIVANRA
ncbi:transcription factor AP-4-like protein [Dinothrombium tinctorium]|uniref:Transcription factor AP-4-like protein n=1 Tax=Dinothrombium tinctorium TaxID=1965070 RepID=A0A3S3QJZ5_9ACAR|nr:transcription factor AP-4-like protein [Dinothrombium tinctorium]